MTYSKYIEYELAFSQYQLKQLADAIQKRTKITLRLNIDQLAYKNADDTKLKVLLTKAQISRIKKHVAENRGIDLDFSLNQLREMSKAGGILPLVTLLPLIFGGLAAAGTTAGVIGDQVHKKLERDESERHNKAIEEETRKAREGTGLHLQKQGDGLFLQKQGDGLFLSKEGGKLHLTEADIGKLFSHLLLKKKI